MEAKNGILLLDKPHGITSNKALSHVKRVFGQSKAGHGGSLDPLAEGMLPVLLGSYTKLADIFLGAVKEYETQCTLGITTDTGDSEGKITGRADAADISEENIEKALANLRGEIMQQPPAYSAIKFKGKPLYKYARAGRPVLVQARKVYIHSLQLIKFSPPHISLAIKCSKGVYVRSLATDLGEALGCGAHVSKLRRTGVGDFPVARMVDLPTLEEASVPSDFFLSFAEICRLVPSIFVSTRQKELFVRGIDFRCQGQDQAEVKAPAGRVCVFTQNTPEANTPAAKIKEKETLFLGTADLQDGHLQPRKVCSGYNTDNLTLSK